MLGLNIKETPEVIPFCVRLKTIFKNNIEKVFCKISFGGIFSLTLIVVMAIVTTVKPNIQSQLQASQVL